ncbi:MAG TPA: hypothetical protein VEJ67_18190 [Candidatus Cybelea sp.]|nr:hypothetical protein [Candidatus Cybelea sp.]
MELVLNIIWLLIALAAFGLWRTVWRKQPRYADRRPLEEWTAFACVLIFLFFAVSLSDDLHASAILADDCGGRRHALVLSCATHAQGHSAYAHASPAEMPGRDAAPPAPPIVSRIAPAALSALVDAKIRFTCPRAPPFALV